MTLTANPGALTADRLHRNYLRINTLHILALDYQVTLSLHSEKKCVFFDINSCL